MADELTEEEAEAARLAALVNSGAEPKRVKGDQGEVEAQSIADQIALDKYLATKKAAKKRGGGVTFKKFVPPGAD